MICGLLLLLSAAGSCFPLSLVVHRGTEHLLGECLDRKQKDLFFFFWGFADHFLRSQGLWIGNQWSRIKWHWPKPSLDPCRVQLTPSHCFNQLTYLGRMNCPLKLMSIYFKPVQQRLGCSSFQNGIQYNWPTVLRLWWRQLSKDESCDAVHPDSEFLRRFFSLGARRTQMKSGKS